MTPSQPFSASAKEDASLEKEARSLESSVGVGFVEDPVMEGRVWRKLDHRVLPVMTMFYLLSFLDRTNVGNARVAGLQTDLGMSNKQYSIALTVTYVPYILSELPSNLMLKAVGPHLMLPTMLTLWGIVTALQGIVDSYSGLLACRFFIGLLEGGVFPGLVLYLSYFYPRYKMNTRITLFFSSASLSGAFSGILAYGIIRMDGIGNRPGWSWIFILEGLFTFLFGLSSYFVFPRSLEKTWFLSPEEKAYVKGKLLEDTHKEEEVFTWKEVIEAFKLPQLWLLGMAFFFAATILFGLAYFSPSIIQGLGYTAADAQLMSVPPYAVACIVALIASFISDRYRCRGIVCIVSVLFCAIGFAMFLGSQSKRVQYGSLFFSVTGAYMAAPTQATWNANNASPQTRRATVIAMGFILANSGGIVATWLLGSLSPAPRYTKATITLLVFSLLAALFSVLNLLYLRVQNGKKAERRKTMSREDEEPGLGNHSAWYIYNL
ncbi:major facilitator superfamily domain-containing protein [Lentinula aff. detonsa]|uniref:Major facilitator superfamily domain-containing protein n=1 Tax=Lentinula aff. detonsa TaxID=2804958 RepID=A0AA38KX66_9AGAR|nr:major facilitator superfamily domain-containing protein [Lentinula aff. detonsa]KAJ3795786.1 major facilitator superfamily domain-containing protein [Lentinula aff. detonsa]